MMFARSLCGGRWFVALFFASMAAFAQAPGTAAPTVAAKSCAALKSRVDAVPGKGPLFLRSYDGADGVGEPQATPGGLEQR